MISDERKAMRPIQTDTACIQGVLLLLLVPIINEYSKRVS